MGKTPRFSRRLLVGLTAATLSTACVPINLFNGKERANRDPLQTLDDYFGWLTTGKYRQAQDLLSKSFQDRLGPTGTESLLHSFRSVKVENAEDAVGWANHLGAHLPDPPADRREYLVTLSVVASETGTQEWSDGVDRRFIDLIWQNEMWKIDAIGVIPGILVTGKMPESSSSSQLTNGARTLVIPTAPLKVGAQPVDKAIYTARQSAVARGLVPWATDPVQVVHHDGPSFGIDAGSSATLVGKDSDPATLVPRARVLVNQSGQALIVTLIQPIQPGDDGVWAISEIEHSS